MTTETQRFDTFVFDLLGDGAIGRRDAARLICWRRNSNYVRVVRTDETGECVWAVVVDSCEHRLRDFWLDAFDTLQKAKEFCDRLGLSHDSKEAK